MSVNLTKLFKKRRHIAEESDPSVRITHAQIRYSLINAGLDGLAVLAVHFLPDILNWAGVPSVNIEGFKPVCIILQVMGIRNLVMSMYSVIASITQIMM